MCCANRNRLLEQGSNSLFLYDLCQTVYLSPQICIPAGDVDACLSTESSLLRLCIFQTALKNTFFPWCYFRTLERARERHGFIRRVLFESLRVMHDGFSFFRTMIRQIEAICYRSATNGSFSTCISNLFFIFSLAKLSTPILSPRQKSLKCFVWFDDSIFS